MHILRIQGLKTIFKNALAIRIFLSLNLSELSQENVHGLPRMHSPGADCAHCITFDMYTAAYVWDMRPFTF